MNRIYNNNYEENEDQRYVAKDFGSPLGGNKYYFQAENRDLNMKKNYEPVNHVYSCNNEDLSIEVRVRGDRAKEQFYSQNYYSRDNYYMMDNSCQYDNDCSSPYNNSNNFYNNNQYNNNYNQNSNFNLVNACDKKKEYYQNDEYDNSNYNNEYNKNYEMQNNPYNLNNEYIRNNKYNNNYYDTYENNYYNGSSNYNNYIYNNENDENNTNNQYNNEGYCVEDNNNSMNINRDNNVNNSLNNLDSNFYDNGYCKNTNYNNDENNYYNSNDYCYEKDVNKVITNDSLENNSFYENINNKTTQQNISILNVYSDGIVDGVFKDKYGMRGEHKIKNMPAYSIPIGWSCGPRETQAYALSIMNYDSVPIFGFPWIHWLVTDIPAHNTFLKENISRHERYFTEGLTSFAEGYLVRLSELSDIRVPNEFAIGYGGFIPINKPNTYIVKVYALSAPLNLRRGFTYNEMLEAMEGKVLAHGILKAVYNN